MSMKLTRRELAKIGLGLGAATALGRHAFAQAPAFLRIGTGGTGGTYYPIGGLIGNAISIHRRSCRRGRNERLGGQRQRHRSGGSMESGFSQADVNFWAFTGTGIYEGKPKVEELRAIANLYPESVHIVMKKGARRQVGRRLEGQARLPRRAGFGHARQCQSHPCRLRSFREGHQARVPEAATMRRETQGTAGSDAYFQTTGLSPGYAHGACRDRTASSWCRWLVPRPMQSAAVQVLCQRRDSGRYYKDVAGVKTLSVGAQWVTSAKMPMRSSMRSQRPVERQDPRRPRCRPCQGQGDPQGERIGRRRHPVHPGAEKFYKEAGLSKG